MEERYFELTTGELKELKERIETLNDFCESKEIPLVVLAVINNKGGSYGVTGSIGVTKRAPEGFRAFAATAADTFCREKETHHTLAELAKELKELIENL